MKTEDEHNCERRRTAAECSVDQSVALRKPRSLKASKTSNHSGSTQRINLRRKAYSFAICESVKILQQKSKF